MRGEQSGNLDEVLLARARDLEDRPSVRSARRRRSAPGGEISKQLADVNPEDYVAVVIPGGRAPEYIRNDPDARRIARHFVERDKPVAQLCHGPLVTAAAGVMRGRRTSAYPALEPDMIAAGAEFVDSEALVDGVVVSARAWPDHPSWMREFMKVLLAKAPVS